MRKKSLILLTASLLSLGVVGGTFAAWAVTDNADPFSVRVSPGSVSTDTTTTYVRLEWGSSKEVSNVANLKLDTYRKVGVVGLLADTSNSASFKGKLSITVDGTAALKSALNVKLYEGNLAATDGVISATTIAAATEIPLTNYVADNLQVTDNTERLVTPVVYLNSMSAAEYAQLSTAVVTLEFDWGVGSGEETVTTQTFYATGFGSDPVYAYAWKGDAQNAAWPGVLMNAAQVNGYKTAEINIAAYDKIIFHNNVEGEGSKKSGDITIATSFTGTNNCFTYTGSGDLKGTFGEHDDIVSPEYYLVGCGFNIGTAVYNDDSESSNFGWVTRDAGRITLTDGVGTISITTTQANARLKVIEKQSNTWYSNDGNDFVIGQAGNYTITFRLNPGAGQAYIACA